MKTRRSEPEIVLRNGKPAAVILDIAQYEELLERAEDTYDLARLRAMRGKPLRFKALGDFVRGGAAVRNRPTHRRGNGLLSSVPGGDMGQSRAARTGRGLRSPAPDLLLLAKENQHDFG